ncbi:hypothetical protein SAMN04515620_11435 [Collimonas sp. OK607]|nr:hypothetical protein SAMN04515620_11435 [Collimonas sp. OK607]
MGQMKMQFRSVPKAAGVLLHLVTIGHSFTTMDMIGMQDTFTLMSNKPIPEIPSELFWGS